MRGHHRRSGPLTAKKAAFARALGRRASSTTRTATGSSTVTGSLSSARPVRSVGARRHLGQGRGLQATRRPSPSRLSSIGFFYSDVVAARKLGKHPAIGLSGSSSAARTRMRASTRSDVLWSAVHGVLRGGRELLPWHDNNGFVDAVERSPGDRRGGRGDETRDAQGGDRGSASTTSYRHPFVHCRRHASKLEVTVPAK